MNYTSDENKRSSSCHFTATNTQQRTEVPPAFPAGKSIIQVPLRLTHLEKHVKLTLAARQELLANATGGQAANASRRDKVVGGGVAVWRRQGAEPIPGVAMVVRTLQNSAS